MGVVRGGTICQRSNSNLFDESFDNTFNFERGNSRNLNLPFSSHNSSRRSSGYDYELSMNLISPMSPCSPINNINFSKFRSIDEESTTINETYQMINNRNNQPMYGMIRNLNPNNVNSGSLEQYYYYQNQGKADLMHN